MAAYICVEWAVKDEAALKRYSAAARDTITKAGGVVLGAGPFSNLQGALSAYTNMVLIAFDDATAAKSWFNSPEYAETIPDRTAAMDARFMLLGP